MSQAAAEPTTAAASEPVAANETEAAPAKAMGSALKDNWRRNLETATAAARGLQHENVALASQLVALQMQAARTLAAPRPWQERLTQPMQLGAAAVEIWVGYLGRTTELAQRTLADLTRQP